MSNLREAAQQALEALKLMLDEYGEANCPASDHADAAIDALRTALAEPEERQTMTPKELADSLKRGEKWIVIEEKT
tara:strand:+ start:972 stop:1199 length:228 start_codon:yes stop_codon:yes gene_type:complete